MNDRVLVDLCHQFTDQGVAPNVALGWAARTHGGWIEEVAGDVGRVFDLASLTKPMTAVVLAGSGLDPHRPLREFLAELEGAWAAEASLESLLAHRAGLEARIDLFERTEEGALVPRPNPLFLAANAVRATLDEGARGGFYPPVYSDLGYVLVGEVLARRHGVRDVGVVLREWMAEPLGLQADLGTVRDFEADCGASSWSERVVPTEFDAARGGLIRGQVHDENAWVLTGKGASGHAGMFGTLRGVLGFGRAVLDGLVGGATPFGRPVDLRWLVEPRSGGTLRAGFDGRALEGSSAGNRMGARTFGHLGFTGTSLWIDPDAEVVTVLLTNRVSPSRANQLIRLARPRAHDTLFTRAMEIRSNL